jgi:two-component system cell cycle response regulator
LGRHAEAQHVLDECVGRCEQHGLTAIRVRARREQAELHAAGGDYRAAYAEHTRYCYELQELQSAQRDARARAVHAMYETTEARKQSRRWRELSLRDPLTGLYNRRYVDEQLARVLRGPDPVTVALLDLDHFKKVNDTCSHEVGDEVLRTFASLLREDGLPLSAGPDSFAARIGGEEFILVLVGVDAWLADRHLELVRALVADHPWHAMTGSLPVTVSIGATSTAAPADVTPAELLARADGYLYQAKRDGRDRVAGDLVTPPA